ncbi:hypothetical protein Dsin_031095 [Dipteronia sinensis]|uniref:Ribosomal protein L30 ferredoxin-like fold domain-containing protein n=1 Tax=Dipteronia sinensis TaxID=43782 RepID=A0AAD9ZM90_9ROSI|nr:hypothetical protein Dsin_031095 [Dipteronia sinensis]
MAEEEAKPLAYIAETVLKKRKSTEAFALARKAQLESGGGNMNTIRKRRRRFTILNDLNNSLNSLETSNGKMIASIPVELDLIRMKQRGKKSKSATVKPKSELLFIVRIQGKNDMHPKTRKILYPNLKNVKELIYKKGYGNLENQRVPLTDNNIIEQALGKYGIICIEDMVHEIANVGPHFKEVITFLGPFFLNKPEGLLGKKQPYKDGGEAGNREDHINELIEKMN